MIIVIQCRDQVGLVASISSILARAGLNIVSMREHVEKEDNRFFSRIEAEGLALHEGWQQELRAALPPEASLQINPLPEKRLAVLVTREYHCLGDILLRHQFGTLGARLACVLGNHPDLGDLCRRFEVPFLHVPHEGRPREAFESALLDGLAPYQPDFLVLAKFMRILSPAFVAQYRHRIINIHHSFLPAFAGAQPYRQAFARGVKLIGATSHFVTDDLDEGPIIAQQIIPVTHRHRVEDMVRAGKEVETAVLARAMQLVFEDRVLVHRNKTIVFE
ncbi:MAG TPA: formyltetrahydrofolate deformylase [Chitinophagaceae bacterium]|nr:formyltetrahydrofolate deformylase [Chitinophagaceae bacterium]